MDKDTVEFLNGLKREEGRASPRYWVIYDYKKIPTNKDLAHESVVFTPKYQRDLYLEELVGFIKGVNEEDNLLLEQKEISRLKERVTVKDYKHIENWVQRYIDEESEMVWVWSEGYSVPNMLFVTKEEAADYLKNNQHKFTKEAHIEEMEASNSPTIARLKDIIEETVWDKELQ